jgi:hypothetical protein
MIAGLTLYHEAISSCFSNIRGFLADKAAVPSRATVSEDKIPRANKYYKFFRLVFEGKNIRAVAELLALIQRIYEQDWADFVAVPQGEAHNFSDLMVLHISKCNPALEEGPALLQARSLSAIVLASCDCLSVDSIQNVCYCLF